MGYCGKKGNPHSTTENKGRRDRKSRYFYNAKCNDHHELGKWGVLRAFKFN